MRSTMFDEVIVAVADDEAAALGAPALGRALASPVAALTPAQVDADRSDGAERVASDDR